jgi:Glycosyltransferase family 9 (heptosyltransferase)
LGFGDDIMATGLARGARARGKRIAFGDGNKIVWGPWSEEMFENNPNIAAPGTEKSSDIEWCDHYKGKRRYNKLVNGKWVWNYDFAPTPGEFYFSDFERNFSSRCHGYVVIEPNVPWQKEVATNKDWGAGKYEEVGHRLIAANKRLIQFQHKNTRRIVPGATLMTFGKFRQAVAALAGALLYIGPEGGMHHAAAAVGINAVVLFGGFPPPSVLGYHGQVLLTGISTEACGNIKPCDHCRKAMASIEIEQVTNEALRLLG